MTINKEGEFLKIANQFSGQEKDSLIGTKIGENGCEQVSLDS